MASCAACLQPLLNAQPFVLDGTEVFHRACARNAYRSKLRLSEQRTRELEAQVTATRSSAARVEAEAHQLRNDVAHRSAEICQLEAQLAGVRYDLAIAQERLQARQGELQGARNQLAALRVELEQKVEQEPQEAPAEDSTALRFRLLELD
jgi:chromosome segregation ATPase